MALNSRQRAQLRGMANQLDVIVHVGKGGISDNLVTQVNDALEARELIKGKVLDNSLLTARTVCLQNSSVSKAKPHLSCSCTSFSPLLCYSPIITHTP